jgi:hypothetical protein
MASLLPSCPACNAPLGETLFNRLELVPCQACGAPVQAEIFPALFRPSKRGEGGEPIMVEGESSCFYHPQKKAVVPCEGCGRFLCGLCDCELHGEHYCPACLEVGRQKGKIQRLQNQRTRYDSIALAVAILPLLIFYLTIISAPLALFLALRYWKAPRSIVHRTRIRLVLAITLATLQILGWGVAIYFIVSGMRSNA